MNHVLYLQLDCYGNRVLHYLMLLKVQEVKVIKICKTLQVEISIQFVEDAENISDAP
jgi:hypothetical protein